MKLIAMQIFSKNLLKITLITCLSPLVAFAFASPSQKMDALSMAKQIDHIETTDDQKQKTQSSIVYHASEQILKQTTKLNEVAKVLQLIGELVFVVSPADLEDNEPSRKVVSTVKLQQRINVSYQSRYLLLENLAKILNKYSPMDPSLADSIVPELYNVALYDWSTHNRRLAMLMIVKFDKDHSRVQNVLSEIAFRDGHLIVNAESNNGRVRVDVNRGRKNDGTPMFKLELPVIAIVSKVPSWFDKNKYSYDIDFSYQSFTGSREEIQTDYSNYLSAFDQSVSQSLEILRNPNHPQTKDMLAKELESVTEAIGKKERQLRESQPSDFYYKSIAQSRDAWLKIKEQLLDQKIPIKMIKYLLMNQEILHNFVKTGKLLGPSYFWYGIEVYSDKNPLIDSTDQISYLANGVTYILSENTRLWAKNLHDRLVAGEEFDLERIMRQANYSNNSLVCTQNERAKNYECQAKLLMSVDERTDIVINFTDKYDRIRDNVRP